MESLLLGALAVTGMNSSKQDKKFKNSQKYDPNELNSKYNSNMENIMGQL